MNLSKKQMAIFTAWEACDDGCGFSFVDLEKKIKESRVYFAAAVRELAAMGLLEFRRGLMTEDGDLYGSGYLLTPAGYNVLRKNPAAGRDEVIHQRSGFLRTIDRSTIPDELI